MLLFKPYHVFPIVCEGQAIRKTETRRSWSKARAKAGSVHQCKLNFYDLYFAKVEILDVYEQSLGEMTGASAKREGGYTGEEYARLWEIINKRPLNPLEEVFVVQMRCVESQVDPIALKSYENMYRMHMDALRGSM